MNKRIKKKQRQLKNKKLCKRYPFIALRDWRTDEPFYEFTYLDDMPDGWRKAFGTEMCEEIRRVLVKANYLNKYRVLQVKEKYGSLRWYDGCVPLSISRELQDVIDKYEEMSIRTCIWCGRPATKTSLGWISPWCDNCAKRIGGKFRDINEEPLVF